ncbi:MAG: alpha/beta hydrolase [Bdellovibrionaceae bacterium]|nr:alpha/beta hydrolase [Pseudobdellovibrionaceae bacterium]NUM58891.1 alpha/beta hydrolase [Pseudobdellovibrionaceae bacterium]
MGNILGNFNYRITGDLQRPKVVFLHGLMGFLNNWGSVVRGLSDRYCCLVYDQRGHGKSMKPAFGYQPEDYANDLNQIIVELGWDKIILVGHSMGGRNALCFSKLFPEKLDKLVIVDISPDYNPNSFVYFEKMLNLVPTPFSTQDEMKLFFETRFIAEFPAKEDAKVLAKFLMANLVSLNSSSEDGNSRIDWKFSKVAILESVKLAQPDLLWNWVEHISCECLYIRGNRSKDLDKETFDRIIKSNSMIKGVEISDAGHWVHSEQPVLFLNELKKFLDYNKLQT